MSNEPTKRASRDGRSRSPASSEKPQPLADVEIANAYGIARVKRGIKEMAGASAARADQRMVRCKTCEQRIDKWAAHCVHCGRLFEGSAVLFLLKLSALSSIIAFFVFMAWAALVAALLP